MVLPVVSSNTSLPANQGTQKFQYHPKFFQVQQHDFKFPTKKNQKGLIADEKLFKSGHSFIELV